MQTIYELDASRCWTGGVREIGDLDGVPAGWAATPVAPVPNDGEKALLTADWTWDYVPSDWEDPAKAGEAKKLAFDQQMAAALVAFNEFRQSPMTWDFGDTPMKDEDEVLVVDEENAPVSAGVQSLQMRDTLENPDQRNWQAAVAGANEIPVEARDVVVIPLKTTENFWIQTTANQALRILANMVDQEPPSALARGYQMIARHGQLKKTLRDLMASPEATAEDILAVDVRAGWPA